VTPAYRERLRTEGVTLIVAGALGSALLLRFTEQARRWPLNTAGQLALTAGLHARFGPRAVHKSMAQATPLEVGNEGTGEPTPLWHVPVPVLGLALLFKGLESLPGPGTDKAGWDASLRITLGSLITGIFQATLLERTVAAEEQATGRRYYRVPGSRLGRGTLLGFTASPTPAP
jgi:hypothetical protein